MLVIGTASLIFVDGAKQAGLVVCSGIYLFRLYPVAIFFKVREFGGLFIYLYIALVTIFYIAVATLYVTMLAANRW